jgi:hypothetical protein
MTGTLIGLTGRKRSGKNTVATILRIEHGFHETSFAEPIREFTMKLLNLTPEQLDSWKEEPILWLDGKVTPRQIMQRMGTEFGRQMVHPELWVRRALLGVEGYLKIGRSLVLSDVRFQNECDAIRALGGVIVHVRRPSADCVVDTHESERPVPAKFGDFFIDNDGDIDQLETRVEQTLTHIRTQREVQAEFASMKPAEKF